jgi:enamine deaminase RidA (YjgF/YER057c/UK114 family)
MDIQRIQPNNRLSRALIYDGRVYVTGQVARNRVQDVFAQTTEVLGLIDELLEQSGTDKNHILFAQIWLRNIETDFARMNEAWEAWVEHGHVPARATVEAKLASPDILVEITVTAATVRAGKSNAR